MSKPAGEDRQVEFVFKYHQDYRVVPANGVWVGPTTRGDMRVDFFVESFLMPDSVTHLVNEEGGLGAELRRSPPGAGKFERVMQFGLVMSLDQLESAVDFIKTRIKEARTQRQGGK